MADRACGHTDPRSCDLDCRVMELERLMLPRTALDVARLARAIHGADPTSGGPNDICGCYAEAAKYARAYQDDPE